MELWSRIDALSQLVDSAMGEGLIRAFAAVRGNVSGEEDSFFRGEIAEGSGIPCSRDTIFDVASLTKVVGTTICLALLIEKGQLSPEDTVGTFLPEITKCRDLTIRELATHYSGLERLKLGTGEEMEKALLEVAPANPPGTTYLYSCLNFHILSRIAEKISGERLEDLAEKNIFLPLGMKDTSWGISKDLSRTLETINAPAGTISDEWARAFMPRRTGNAGIFSTAEDLGKFARMLLGKGKGFFTTDIVERELFRISSPEGKEDLRSFGFNAAPDGLPASFSPGSIFHTGWTGQSLFLDPVKGIYCIILTCRKGEHHKCAAFRRKAADIFVQAQ